MTVKQLIRSLSTCDQDAEVEISYCYTRSKVVPGDCIELVGRDPIILRDPDNKKIELCTHNR